MIARPPRRLFGLTKDTNVQFAFADYVLDTERASCAAAPNRSKSNRRCSTCLPISSEHRDRVVTKDDLIASIWGGRIVSDTALTSRIYAARKAIGDTGRDQKLIRTISRKGLRFVGTASSGDPNAGEPSRRRSATGRFGDDCAARLPLPDRAAIAVLPFTNMSGDPEQEYFSDGISEDIITALSKLRWFFVIARNSSFIYKDKAVHIKQVAEELGVSYVLEGSVRRSGERVRITAQLNDVIHGSHLWAERYDRDARRRVRGAGRDHGSHRRGDRAAALCGGKFPRPAQASGAAWMPGNW